MSDPVTPSMSHDAILNALVRENPFGVYVVASDFSIRQISRGAEKVFANIRPVLGRDLSEVLLELWPEPFASEAIGRFRHTLETGDAYAATPAILTRRDAGRAEAYDWRIARIVLPDGKYGVVCYFYDLSEWRIWEELLSESEARRTLAMTEAHLADWDYELTTGRNTWDQRLDQMLGLSSYEANHDSELWRTLVFPEDRDNVDTQFRAAVEGRSNLAVEFRVRRPDGEVRWVSSKGTLIRDGEGRPERLVGIAQDVTDRVQAAAVLSQALARLGAATAAAHLGIHEYLPSTQTLFWDARMRELWGIGPDEPVTYELFMDRLHPDDRAATQACVNRALDPQGDGRYLAEYRVRRGPGDQIWVRATGAVTFANGKAERLLGTVQDITEFKSIEAALRSADRRKDRFLATLSHELRNPLAPIRHAAEILCAQGMGIDRLQWARGVIDRQVSHMAALLDDLLDVSRITQGKLPLKRRPSRLPDVVATAVETVRPLIDRKRHRLSVELPAQIPLLDVDPVRISQVIANLLNNSAKYTNDGGTITLSAVVEDQHLRMVVIDDGIGLAAESLPLIFEMFSQVHPESSHTEGGLGIGLALVRGIVELHGGSVRALSAGPGKGSSFELVIPTGRPLVSEVKPATSASAARCLRILVADDNADAVDSLSLLLGMSGHEVRIARNGAEAVSIAVEFRPHVALIDIGMPVLDGYAAARAIRTHVQAASACLVALTGWGQQSDRLAATSAGFDHHLTKPLDFDKLQGILDTVLVRD